MGKIAATYDEVNTFLRAKGLKVVQIPEGLTGSDELKVAPGSAVAQGVSDSLGQISAPTKRKPAAPLQPKWKWSWEPSQGLLIWSVDPKYGQPHHIEVTGPNFYQYAQGRVYVDYDGTTEILVWADRGSEDWQDQAVEDVDNWLEANTGREADDVIWSSEGGYYQKLKPGQKPNRDKMIQTYFQVDKSKLQPTKWKSFQNTYDDILKTYDPEKEAPPARVTDKDWRGQLDEPQLCPECGGDGVTLDGHVCAVCHGTGTLA